MARPLKSDKGKLIVLGIDVEKKEILATPVPIRFGGREKR
jgi:hypothetical protein